MRTWAEMRRTYVNGRQEELQGVNPGRGAGNWRQFRKDQAHAEFNQFVEAEKKKAVEEYKRSISA